MRLSPERGLDGCSTDVSTPVRLSLLQIAGTHRRRVIINHVHDKTRNRLKNCSILDSGTSDHITNKLHCLTNYRPAEGAHALCGSENVQLYGFGSLTLHFKGSKKLPNPKSIVLRDVAYCEDFPLTIVSLQQLESMGIDWSHRSGRLTLHGRPIGYTQRANGQCILQENEFPYHQSSIFATTRSQARLDTSLDHATERRPETLDKEDSPADEIRPTAPEVPRVQRDQRQVRPSWANGDRCHQGLGHIGPNALNHSAFNTLGSQDPTS